LYVRDISATEVRSASRSIATIYCSVKRLFHGLLSIEQEPLSQVTRGPKNQVGQLEDNRYINMDLLREERKEQLRKAA
jgi:hypothetical protein